VRPCVLVVTDRQLYPQWQGNRARIIELVRSLRSQGFSVALVTRTNPGWRSTLRTRLLVDRLVTVPAPEFHRGSPSTYDCSPFYRAIERMIERCRPRAVIAEYIWMAPCLDLVDGRALRVLDTHDLMHVRQEVYEREDAWVYCSPVEEGRLLEKADVIIAIQRNERERFGELAPGKTVICVPHSLAVRPAFACRKAGGHVVAFVASSSPANRRGLAAFIRDSWPIVKRSCPSAELRIYGSVGSDAVWEAAGDDIRTVGIVKKIRAAYETAAVLINPVTLGTGLKIKTVEALSYGKALVTTPDGADGLEEGAQRAFIVADDGRGFGEAVARLLTDSSARRALEDSARAFATATFDRRTVLRELLQLLDAGPVGDAA
jgi:glycosyltransferase involved in cell wall biosynthesis